MSASLSLLDPYQPSSNRVHRTDAQAKLLATLAVIVAVNATPIRAWPMHLGYLLWIVLVIALARTNLRLILRRLLLATPFLLMALVGAPFWGEGQPLWTLPILNGRLAITDVGLWRLANVALKSSLSLLATVTLSLTTPFLEIVRAMQRLGLPAVLSSTILLMYRYLFVLVDEAQRLMRARDARTGDAPRGTRGRSLRWRAQVTGYLIGTLFLRTLERGERIYQAMLARGYDGEIRSLATNKVGWRQMTPAILTSLLLAAAVLLANLRW
jgi:cobalt/nickel transport system permease protein